MDKVEADLNIRSRAAAGMGDKILIGTSGWHYKHWLGPFYPEDLPAQEMLSFYGERFDNVERLTDFLDALPTEYRYSFEFRDRSWHVKEIYKLLKKHNAAFCIYDLAGKESPREITADFAYVRLHGPTQAAYPGSYPPETLKKWARRIKEWQKDVKAVWFI